ncbi:MAG: hypothetical protein JSU03_02670 [Bacteroidetes bacterium]|nr:hypothetical protein [Bacteroidota bacterium]MBS1756162.1 hypothetical protein [Bacteroidota bacterium]
MGYQLHTQAGQQLRLYAIPPLRSGAAPIRQPLSRKALLSLLHKCVIDLQQINEEFYSQIISSDTPKK